MKLITKINNDLLKKSWRFVKQGKSERVQTDSKGIDKVSLKIFKEKEDIYILDLIKNIQNNTFKFSPLSPVVKAKIGKPKDRLLTVPTVNDRIVQKAILLVINSIVYPYINTGVSYCGVKKDLFKKNKNEEVLNTKKALQKIIEHVSQKKFFIFESDIKGFFDNVPKDRMCNKIFSLLPDKSLNQLIKNVIYFELGNIKKIHNNKRVNLPNINEGISQGSPLSPLFSNIYLADFDRAMKMKYSDAFIRYVDDFLVICKTKNEAKEAAIFAENLLKKEKLSLAPEKTKFNNLRSDRLVFLGISLDKDKISTKKNKHEYLQDFYKTVFAKGNSISLMNSKIQGCFNYYKYYHVDNIFTEINKLIIKKQFSKPKFQKLILLDLNKLEPIINQTSWREIFFKS